MSAALLGLSDIAALARVSRPLVSVWRRRKAASTTPFPAPTTSTGGRELFDAAEVASWLMASGLIELAREVAAEADRGQHFTPPLNDDELAFYDAVATNESAVDVQGEDVLAAIARELVAVMRRDIKTDWTVRDDVKAKLRSSIKRLLVKYDYPPDKQPEAIRLVLDQMEAIAPRFAA